MTRACAWGGCSRAFESNATRDAKKLGLMPFEIARKGHRITAPCQECGAKGQSQAQTAETRDGDGCPWAAYVCV